MSRKRPGKKRSLSEQHERFCLEMVRSPSATQAAIRAGYAASSARQIAYDLQHELKASPRIRARIAALAKELEERAGVTQRRIENELEAISFADLRDVVAFDADGLRVIPSDELAPEAAAALLEIKCDETVQSVKTRVLKGELHDLKPGEEIDETTTVLHRRMGVKLHPKVQAIEALARIRKFIRPSSPFGGDDGEGGTIIPVAVMLPAVRSS
jgi:phage terminase small subunit